MVDPRKRDSRPGEKATISTADYPAGVRDESILSDIPGLDTMTPRAQRIALAYYESGHVSGYAAGFRAAEEVQAELDRRAAISAHIIAKGTDLARLAERRGEPEHAARIRARQQKNGLIA